MRKDMFKVIVERPRRGGGKAKGRCKIALEDMPSCEGMRARHVRGHVEKSLNENLAPLKRFLATRVGRPWNKVHSEICRELNVSSTVQKHVKDHLYDFVEVNVVLDENGKPREKVARRWVGYFYKPFYVHPRTGLLCEAHEKSPFRQRVAERRRQEAAERAARELRVAPEVEFHKVNGIWYRAIFADRPAPEIRRHYSASKQAYEEHEFHAPVRDAISGEIVPLNVTRYRKGKAQLSSAELRRHGLVNDTFARPAEISNRAA